MADSGFLQRGRFGELLALLERAGYRVIGPTHRDGAIVYTELHGADELPAGVLMEAQPGRVRTSETQLPRFFAWANGPQALKPLLFRPAETLWEVSRDGEAHLAFSPVVPDSPPLAVIGVRACDLAALALQDAHFIHCFYRDEPYAAQRENLLLVAVNCTHPAETCFCASTGDGPRAERGFDLVLDELDEGFIASAGSARGESLLAELHLGPVREDQRRKAEAASERAARAMTRSIPPGDLFDGLVERLDHPRWLDVAGRCLSCGNCTLVCPTCFCSQERDEPQLEGGASRHLRLWDSCFTEGHSYTHGLVVRGEIRHRYRQWLTHKLGSWHRQYGRSGCVGCGRCIAWCPTGIDITEEVNAILGEGHDG